MILDVLISTLMASPVLAGATYLLGLAVLARPDGSARSRPSAVPRFDIVIPAHDEELGLPATLESLRALDYPTDRCRILVVADNCSDGTADVAREAGAVVLERRDACHRGKGYALVHAFEAVEKDGVADAVVVLDADSIASPNLLRAVAQRMDDGAVAVQARYGVRNPDASWRTRLMVLAFTLFHDVRSLGRERLGLSVGLRGNGMAFTRALLRRVPPAAFSVVEDVEYGLALGEAGIRVHYIQEAHVLGEMTSSGGAATSQRRRWERGRAELARARAPRLLLGGILRRDLVLVDLAVDLLLPPLSTTALLAAGGTTAALLWYGLLDGSIATVFPWLVSTAFLALYVLRGLLLSGVGPRGFFTLLWAPIYIVWKLGLLRGAHRSNSWVRTTRETGRA